MKSDNAIGVVNSIIVFFAVLTALLSRDPGLAMTFVLLAVYLK